MGLGAASLYNAFGSKHALFALCLDRYLDRNMRERIERLEEEKKCLGDDIREVYAEVKAVGYDTKITRQIIRLRKMRPDDRREMEMVLETYKAAVGLG